MIDRAEAIEYGKFMLHYNFPGFSTGEVKPNRAPGRREIGHGNLAHRSLKKVLPPDTENPYTVRVVSDILESNGSSSMATVCAGSLALMDSGVQLSSPVSGIAMGLISEGGRYAILSDILGDEDHLGDMDFKVTGTQKGICAVQMDIKVDGLSYEVLREALAQAREGRLHILAAMNEVIDTPRSEPKPHAPRIEMIIVPREMIGAIIGPGGKVIQEMQRQTNTVINLEETERGGEVTVASANKENLLAAMTRIRGIIAVPEVGEVYTGKVKTITDFGAFVEYLPGKEGLLHVSELAWERVNRVEDVLSEGDMVEVKLLEIDRKSNKVRLSRKALLPNTGGHTQSNERSKPFGGGGFDRRSDRGDRKGGHHDRNRN